MCLIREGRSIPSSSILCALDELYYSFYMTFAIPIITNHLREEMLWNIFVSFFIIYFTLAPHYTD